MPCSAFSITSRLEEQGLWDCMRWADSLGWKVRPIPSSQIPLQLHNGDMLLRDGDGSVVSLELKTEAANKWGNFFIEEWSNRERGRKGWLHSCWATWLLYYFYEEGYGYLWQPDEMRSWAEKEIEQYPLRRQKRYQQRNDTWGWCVPIQVVREQLDSCIGPLQIRETGDEC